MNDAERAADAISKIAAAYAKDIAEAAGLTEVEEKYIKFVADREFTKLVVNMNAELHKILATRIDDKVGRTEARRQNVWVDEEGYLHIEN